jgi:hypothetical protein
MCHDWGFATDQSNDRPIEYKRIALDTSKYVFTLHGVAAEARVSCGGRRWWGFSPSWRRVLTGSMAVIRFAEPGSKSASPWLLKLLERTLRKRAAVALANKNADHPVDDDPW